MSDEHIPGSNGSLPPTLLLAFEQARTEHDAGRWSAVRTEMLRRAEFAQRCAKDPGLRAAEMEMCRRDPVHWVSNWAWTFDPRGKARGLPTTLPMVLRPQQIEYIRWIQERRKTRTSGLTEKSRDEGMTWVISEVMAHGWLFERGFSGLIGSRKLDLVDQRGNMDSIFEKIRFTIRMLPAWMIPAGFTERECFAEARISHPDATNPAAITGEGGISIGRGGRATLAFVDEHAALPGAESVDAALSNTSDVVIYGSTPAGMGNLFARIRFGGKWPVFTFHWKSNPDKNYVLEVNGHTYQPWYELAKARSNDPVAFAQEVDLDYSGSVADVLIKGDWIRAAQQWKPSEESTQRTAGLDVSDGGMDSTVYVEATGPRVTVVQSISGGGLAGKVKRIAYGIDHLRYDRMGPGAGITTTLAEDEDLGFKLTGMANGERPTITRYEDAPTIPATERFANQGSENWWSLRLRFLKTWEVLNNVYAWPEDECISLADLPDSEDSHTLIRQLSQPQIESAGSSGKLRVNKKGQSGKSPDHAESLMYAMARPRAAVPPKVITTVRPRSVTY